MIFTVLQIADSFVLTQFFIFYIRFQITYYLKYLFYLTESQCGEFEISKNISKSENEYILLVLQLRSGTSPPDSAEDMKLEVSYCGNQLKGCTFEFHNRPINFTCYR